MFSTRAVSVLLHGCWARMCSGTRLAVSPRTAGCGSAPIAAGTAAWRAGTAELSTGFASPEKKNMEVSDHFVVATMLLFHGTEEREKTVMKRPDTNYTLGKRRTKDDLSLDMRH